MSISEKEKNVDLLGQNCDVFAKDLSEIGQSNRYPSVINSGNTNPITVPRIPTKTRRNVVPSRRTIRK